ncbi:MAG: lysoplasmalogenase family protein [Sphingopyxis sp.]|uniref:lysoplasmalogenase family protein n=1 Tax=Sphingopyxis sp. TaxID=1908224 RepID=UPI002ABAC9DE|nr:lysoplasmalogenase family protein [Sphingopyxis sp.]MDZ3831259.1 lysoplasmalogenase family protein [Sphingopyxis sp.]
MAAKQGWDRAQWLWWLALLGGASFMIAVAQRMDGAAIHLWKASGVALLAAWAAANARESGGWTIAAALAFGALGDWMLDAIGLMQGAVAFAIGHVLAITLYLRNRRAAMTGSQRLLVLAAVPLSLLAAWGLTSEGTPAEIGAAMGYTAIVALMAATAWASRFPRYRTGVGAMIFLASDLFIFAGEGGRLSKDITMWLVWPLYFAGQALIAWGVVSTLAREAGAVPKDG